MIHPRPGDKTFIFGGQIMVGATACTGLPYDGHLIKRQIDGVDRLNGVKVQRTFVDRRYRGHGLKDPEVYVAQTRGLAFPTLTREMRRTSAIDPIIGHMKADGKLERHCSKASTVTPST